MDLVGQTRLNVHELTKFYAIDETVNEDVVDSVKEIVVDSKTKRTLSPIDQNATSPIKLARSTETLKSNQSKETDEKDHIPVSSNRSAQSSQTPKSSSLKKVGQNLYASKDSGAYEEHQPSGRRAAKDKAAMKLKDDISRLNVYEMQKKRGKFDDEPEQKSARKRKSDVADDES